MATEPYVLKSTPTFKQFKHLALELTKHGIKVVPVQPKDKRCLLTEWQNKATLNPDQIELWNKDNPHYNVGAVAKPDGVWILDADKPGLIAEIETATGMKFPTTFTVQSNKGFHYYFRQTDASRTMGNVKKGDMFDAQVSDKYVVGPGSIHPSGKVYTVVNDSEIVPAPEWLVAWVSQYKDVKAHGTHQTLELDPTQAKEDAQRQLAWLDTFLNINKVETTGAKHYHGGCRVFVDCPQADLHTSQDPTATAIIIRPGFGLQFKCQHAHCDDLDWKWYREQVEIYPGSYYGGAQPLPQLSLEEANQLFGLDEFHKTTAAETSLGASKATAPVLGPTLVEIPEDIVPPFPEDCMYGWLGELAKRLETPLGFAYPAMLAAGAVQTPSVPNIRSNIFVALVGKAGSCKSETIRRAIGRNSQPGIIQWDDPKRVNWNAPGSDRGLLAMFKHEKSYPESFILAQDEMRNLLAAKVKIQASSLPFVINELFDSDTAGNITKDSHDSVNISLTVLGAVACKDTADFQNIFGKEAHAGLARRFILGVTTDTWEYEPPTFTQEAEQTLAYSVQVPKYCWDMLKEWRRGNSTRANAGIHVMRAALISSFIDHQPDITQQAMTQAMNFMEWQERVWEVYQVGDAETKEAEIEAVIMGALNKLKVGEMTNWRSLYKNRHLNSKGNVMVNRVRDSLVREEIVGYDPRTKAIWRK